MSDEHIEVPLQLRWSDMDALRHVNNATIARLFEECRIRAFIAWLPHGADGLSVVVVRQDITYHAPLLYAAEPVRGRIVVSRLGTSSVRFASTLTDPSGVVVARAETATVFVDPDTSRPRPIPDTDRAALAAHVGDLPD